IFVRGKLPAGGRKKTLIEVYDRDKFLTVTGWKITSHGAGNGVEDRSAVLLAWHREVFGPTSPTKRKGAGAEGAADDHTPESGAGQGPPLVLNDSPQVDEAKLRRLQSRFPKVKAILELNTDHPTQSERDQALANYAVMDGWQDQEICDLLVMAR